MAINSPPLSSRRKHLGAALANDITTDSSVITQPLAGTQFEELSMRPDGIFDGMERRPLGGGGGTSDELPGMQKGVCEAAWKLRHGDGLFTLLQASGYTVAGNVATYSASLADRQLLDLKLWEDGRAKFMTGCNLTSLRLEGEAGGYVMARAEMRGIWIDTADEAMPSDPAITKAILQAKAMTLTDGGAALPLMSRFNLDLNLETAPRPTLVNAYALAMYLVEDYAPVLEVDPEARRVADEDSYGKLLAATTAAVSLELTDGTNTVGLGMPKAQRTGVGTGSRDKKLTDPLTYKLHGDHANGAVQFTNSA